MAKDGRILHRIHHHCRTKLRRRSRRRPPRRLSKRWYRISRCLKFSDIPSLKCFEFVIWKLDSETKTSSARRRIGLGGSSEALWTRPVPVEGSIRCQHPDENWLCLCCKDALGSRFVNKYMAEHYHKTSHYSALSFSDLSVWCVFGCASDGAAAARMLECVLAEVWASSGFSRSSGSMLECYGSMNSIARYHGNETSLQSSAVPCRCMTADRTQGP
uniref:UBP-type domain-containing protein n=1 Tax=Kalanchoe fedtschenkoi TaxID=63787 RepID=A0A7N0TVV2_KALFE